MQVQKVSPDILLCNPNYKYIVSYHSISPFLSATEADLSKIAALGGVARDYFAPIGREAPF